MEIPSLLGLVALVGVLIFLGGLFLAVNAMSRKQSAGLGTTLAIFGAVVALLFYTASQGVVQVGATQVAVVFQRIGGDSATNSLRATPLGPGVHIIIPITEEAILYSTETRNYTMSKTSNEGSRGGDDSVEARTSDGQAVFIDIAVIYGIDISKVNQLHIRWQNRYEDGFVRPQVRSEARKIMANYAVSDIYTGATLNASVAGDAARISKLPEIEEKIKSSLVPTFNENGLILQDVLLREITFSPEFIKAIESRQVAEQLAQQARLEADRVRTEAQGRADAAVTAAQGESKAVVERAKGESEAIILKAEAEAQALAKVSEVLKANPTLIQWRYIEKLAEDVRLILLPSNSPFLFDLNSIQQQSGITTGSAPEPTKAP